MEYDVIVVGSGPGGASVSYELAKSGKKVLILERGVNEEINGTILQALRFVGIPGRNILFTSKMVAMVRATVVGGSSIYYYATAFEPPYSMLKKYGVDIYKYVKEVKKEVPVGVLDDRLMGPMSKRIMESAIDLGYNWQKLPKFIYQNRCRPNCDKCNLGCPYGAKWNARDFVYRALKYGAELLDRAFVTRVLISHGSAEGVEFKHRGKIKRAYASVVVISAGGVGTPVILRNTGIKEAGYNFFYDPLIAVFGISDVRGGKEIPMSAGIHFEEDGYVMTDMTIPKFLYMTFAAEVFRFKQMFFHSKALVIMVKIKDRLGGRITKRGGVHKPLTEEDKKRLMSGYERAKKILKHAGAKDIFKSWYVAAHPGGTAKIGDIVDSNLQTKFKNLYVCDCSVIPEEWGLPPTLTILGLGKRLGRYIISQG